jgi:hypothetical protein
MVKGGKSNLNPPHIAHIPTRVYNSEPQVASEGEILVELIKNTWLF